MKLLHLEHDLKWSRRFQCTLIMERLSAIQLNAILEEQLNYGWLLKGNPVSPIPLSYLKNILSTAESFGEEHLARKVFS